MHHITSALCNIILLFRSQRNWRCVSLLDFHCYFQTFYLILFTIIICNIAKRVPLWLCWQQTKWTFDINQTAGTFELRTF